MGYEYKADIAGVEYGMHDIKSANIEQPLFETLSVGNTCSAELTLSVWPIQEIPKGAKIIPYRRESEEAPWKKLGEFFIDSRDEQGPFLELTAYDCMLKTEALWEPSQDKEFPMPMREAAEDIAQSIGTMLDSRCQFNSSYRVEIPLDGASKREVLGYIASAHAGNWIVTEEGKLLLVPLFSYTPLDTNYLVSEDGDAITFGGVRILI